jgi:hypothetical protein
MVVRKPKVGDYYGPHYRDFGADVYTAVRSEAFGIRPFRPEDASANSCFSI